MQSAIGALRGWCERSPRGVVAAVLLASAVFGGAALIVRGQAVGSEVAAPLDSRATEELYWGAATAAASVSALVRRAREVESAPAAAGLASWIVPAEVEVSTVVTAFADKAPSAAVDELSMILSDVRTAAIAFDAARNAGAPLDGPVRALAEVEARAQALAAGLRRTEQEVGVARVAGAKSSAQRLVDGALLLAASVWVVAAGLVLVQLKKAAMTRRLLRQQTMAIAEAQRTIDTRTALLGMVSHELRAPLQSLMAVGELLEIQLGSLPGVDQRVVRNAVIVQETVERMSAQLRTLRDYARAAHDLDSRAMKLENVNPRTVVRDVIATTDTGGLSITVVVEKGAPERLPCDELRLRQILANYLTNAGKYASGTAVVRVAPRAGASGRGAVVRFAIEDEGPGIDDRDRRLIWGPYYRANAALAQPGSGLGLAVVKLLAERPGWVVGHEPRPGGGSIFFVDVQASQPSAAA
jgi:signal transduction histidine kinase